MKRDADDEPLDDAPSMTSLSVHESALVTDLGLC